MNCNKISSTTLPILVHISRAVDESLGTSPESSHESWGSSPSRVTEISARVESRGSRVESSHTKLSSHARVRHYIQYSLESLPITAISGNANHCTERA